jgi:hypothetical protein
LMMPFFSLFIFRTSRNHRSCGADVTTMTVRRFPLTYKASGVRPLGDDELLRTGGLCAASQVLVLLAIWAGVNSHRFWRDQNRGLLARTNLDRRLKGLLVVAP